MMKNINKPIWAVIIALALSSVQAANEYLNIKANGISGSATILSSSTLSVTIEINSGIYTDLPADWWILAEVSGQWYYYNLHAGFTPGFAVSYQGGLQSLASYEVLRISGLPAGTYAFFFGIDFDVNGQLDINDLVYQSAAVTVTDADSSMLIQPGELIYQGVFRLPDYPADPGQGWEWGGNALAYYPDGDPAGGADGCPGSLYGAGNDQLMFVGEITIPAPVISPQKNLSELNTAVQLRPFRDIRAGITDLEQLYNNRMLLYCGLEYLPAQGAQSAGRIYACFGDHFHDAGTPQDVPSHMWTDLALQDNHGAWWISTQSLYSVNDYMFAIPSSWADAGLNTTGKYLATGRFRDGGWSGQGPALFAIAPWKSGNPPPADTFLPATTLLLYSNTRGDDPTSYTINGYHHSDEWSGGAWLTAGDKAAVVFIGTKGQGSCWYGYADGTICPTDGSESPPAPPYPNNDRGWWSTYFEAQMIFYDPADLAAVAAGAMPSHQPQPYAVLNLDHYLWRIDKINHSDFNANQNKDRVGACAFDRANRLLYIVEYRGDVENERPLIHVFKVGN